MTTDTTHILDGRDGQPFDHTCSGSWTFTGLNPGGHEVYHCDRGHWAISVHGNADAHTCTAKCRRAWAIRQCRSGKVIGSRAMTLAEAEREVTTWAREIGQAVAVPVCDRLASTVRAEEQTVLSSWLPQVRLDPEAVILAALTGDWQTTRQVIDATPGRGFSAHAVPRVLLSLLLDGKAERGKLDGYVPESRHEWRRAS